MKRLILLCAFLLSFAHANQWMVDCANQKALYVKIARTPQEQARGFMYQGYILPFEAILFVFQENAPLAFWMKNTFVPLDIRFFNSDLRKVKRYHHAIPCRTDNCPNYLSFDHAQFVLEVPATTLVAPSKQVPHLWLSSNICPFSP